VQFNNSGICLPWRSPVRSSSSTFFPSFMIPEILVILVHVGFWGSWIYLKGTHQTPCCNFYFLNLGNLVVARS
jgi:hypothetical protein